MSSKMPPDYPEFPEHKISEADIERAVNLRKRLEQSREGGESLSDVLSGMESLVSRAEALQRRGVDDEGDRASNFPQWLTSILQGVTLATVIGSAFWLGSLSATVSRSAEKVDKLNDAVMGVGRDGISNRLSVIETKLDGLDKSSIK